MPITDYLDYLLITALITGLLSIFYLLTLLFRIKKLKLIGSIRKLSGLIFFSVLTAFSSLLIVTAKGYQALTHESHIADLIIEKYEGKQFKAILNFKNGNSQQFDLAGDEIMIESNILKWKPWSNILGLRTAYRLDRIRGRYRDIQVEKLSSPTLFSLRDESQKDISDWRKEYHQLSFLVDVEHGSASYVAADKSQTYQLMVSNDGLILRPEPSP